MGPHPRLPAVGAHSKATAGAHPSLHSACPGAHLPIALQGPTALGLIALKPGGREQREDRLQKRAEEAEGWGEKSKAKIEQSSYHKPQHTTFHS